MNPKQDQEDGPEPEMFLSLLKTHQGLSKGKGVESTGGLNPQNPLPQECQ